MKISWRPFFILHVWPNDVKNVLMCLIILLDTETCALLIKSTWAYGSISNIGEDMITLMIYWRPFLSLNDNDVEFWCVLLYFLIPKPYGLVKKNQVAISNIESDILTLKKIPQGEKLASA